MASDGEPSKCLKLVSKLKIGNMTSHNEPVESSNSNLITCLNRSCGQKFDPDSNGPEDCKFHPGAPVFHDGLKGWSCCKRRVRDFTEFLNIPGCARGQHNTEKPPMPTTSNSVPEACPDPLVCSTDGFLLEQKSVKLIEPRLPRFEDIQRPPSDECLVPIKIIVSDSLKKAIEASGNGFFYLLFNLT